MLFISSGFLKWFIQMADATAKTPRALGGDKGGVFVSKQATT
jgi:hypothetical protein